MSVLSSISMKAEISNKLLSYSPKKHDLRLPIAEIIAMLNFMIRILFLGEVTGRPGITAIKNGLAALKTEYDIDYTIANGEGMTNGFGIGKAHSLQLGKLGVDTITGAEKLFYKVDMVEFVPKAGFILRPANYPPLCPGHGYRHVVIKSRKFAIINIQGNSNFPRQNIQNAFFAADSILKKLKETNPEEIPVVIFHAATTAEKKTMKFYLDGRAAAVIGTHTKVLTADEDVTAKGTAYITDTGRVGSFMSAGGFDPESEIKKLRSQLPIRSQECWNDGVIQGVIVSIDEETGKATQIERIMKHIEIKRPDNSAS